jgi:hypothetical protein
MGRQTAAIDGYTLPAWGMTHVRRLRPRAADIQEQRYTAAGVRIGCGGLRADMRVQRACRHEAGDRCRVAGMGPAVLGGIRRKTLDVGDASAVIEVRSLGGHLFPVRV